VFSRPESLRDWCEEHDVNLEDRRHLITDAGRCAPDVTLESDEVEFFIHSPFASRQDDNEVVQRNNDALVTHATFVIDDQQTKVFLASDVDHTVLDEIVSVTESRNNSNRLDWDLFKLPHHCSYKALGPEKGEDKTKPIDAVRRLFEDYSNERPIIVSTSDTIPSKGDDRDTAAHPNPPHRQAANYYKEDAASPADGEFKATMEHPRPNKPAPLEIEITSEKGHVRKTEAFGGIAAAAITPPRAG